MQSHRYKTSISLFSINTFLAYFHTVDITSIYLFTRYSMHFPITNTHSHTQTRTHTHETLLLLHPYWTHDLHISRHVILHHIIIPHHIISYITSYITSYHIILYLILVYIFFWDRVGSCFLTRPPRTHDQTLPFPESRD